MRATSAPRTATVTLPRCANSALEEVARSDRYHAVQRAGEDDVARGAAPAESSPARSPARRRSVRGCRAPPRRPRCRSAHRCAEAAPRPGAGPAAVTGVIRAAQDDLGRRGVVGDGVGEPAPASPRCGCPRSRSPASPRRSAVSASAMVTPGPARSRASTKAISASTRGCTQRARARCRRPRRGTCRRAARRSRVRRRRGRAAGPRRQPDLAPADHCARRDPAVDVVALDRVGVLDGQVSLACP